MQAAGVSTDNITADPDVSSGVAIIAVDDNAENNIIIVPGANGRVGQPDVDRLGSHLAESSVLLLQLEVPLAATIAAAKLAQQHDVTVVLDPAPVQNLPAALYPQLDTITPNEVEAAQLVGFPIETRDDAFKAAAVLLERGVTTVIVKMGALGVVYATQSGEKDFVPAFSITAIDTVAAGDAFNGGFAAALIQDLPLAEAVRWGAAAGALSATKAGAQPSMPTRAEFDRFLHEAAERS